MYLNNGIHTGSEFSHLYVWSSEILTTWYMSVHTGTYLYVPTYNLLGTGKFQVCMYCSTQFLKSTYRYVPVSTDIDMYCTRQYRAVQATVQGNTGQYMTVQGSTAKPTFQWGIGLYRVVHDSTKLYRQSTGRYRVVQHTIFIGTCQYRSVCTGTYCHVNCSLWFN